MRLYDIEYLRGVAEVTGWAVFLEGNEGLLSWRGAGKYGTFSFSRWHTNFINVFHDKYSAERRAAMHHHGKTLEVRLRGGLRKGVSDYHEVAYRGDEFLIIKRREKKEIESKGKRAKAVRPRKNRR